MQAETQHAKTTIESALDLRTIARVSLEDGYRVWVADPTTSDCVPSSWHVRTREDASALVEAAYAEYGRKLAGEPSSAALVVLLDDVWFDFMGSVDRQRVRMLQQSGSRYGVHLLLVA